MRKLTALLLVCLMTMTLFSVCASADGEKVLHSALNTDITTMDCMLTTNDYGVPMNIYDRLFDIKVGENGNEIVNKLCERYTVSDDGLVYTFKLVEGVEYSNGEPLTSEDVIFTFMHLLAPESVNPDIPLEVVGAEDYLNGDADSVEGIVAVDDYTVEITLSAPNAGFIAELTAPCMGILDKTSTESAENFGINVEETIGCGPYIVTEWVNNDHITLVRNENYWGERPDVDKYIIHIIADSASWDLLYQSGELDIVDLDYIDTNIVNSVYTTVYADKIIAGTRVGLTMMCLNSDNEYLSDINVRKAVQMAINRQDLIDLVLNGDGTIENGIIPAGVVGHNDNITQINYDPDAAKALLAEAGYAEGEITLELSVDNSSTPNTQRVCQLIQQDLQAVGINVELKSYDPSAWLELRKAGNMCSFVGTWTMDYNDPANIMYTFFGSADKTKIRSLNYADEEVMARVAAAPSIVDDAERYAEYQALEEKIVHEDAAWVPLYESKHLFAVSDNIESFTPYWAGFTEFYVADVVMK